MNFISFYILFHDPIWVAVLSAALFFPVRQMIWVLYVRKKQKSQKFTGEKIWQIDILKKPPTIRKGALIRYLRVRY